MGDYETQASLCHMPIQSGGDGREKIKREGTCGGTHVTFPLCFGEERNKVLILSCEGILDVEGHGFATHCRS